MQISARVSNRKGHHDVVVETNGKARSIEIPPKTEAPGSSVNGGELLFLALATCYCNDVYREAATKVLRIDAVDVTVRGAFGGRGDPAREIRYSVRVESPEDPLQVEALLRETDQVAEIQNTLRLGMPVVLESVEVRGGG